MESNKQREGGSECEEGGALIFLVQRSSTAERLQREVAALLSFQFHSFRPHFFSLFS